MHIIHETDSLVVIATPESNNAKTGPMIQIWIMSRLVHPVESRRTGHDATLQCQGCPHASNNGCYVSPLPLMAIWRAYQASVYKHLMQGSPEWNVFFDGASVRFGAYGNPSLIPLGMVADIVARSYSHTGYFHDWDIMPIELARAYGQYFMASCEPHNLAYARNLGLRAFTVVSSRPLDPAVGIECLADKSGLQCVECGLCDGTARSVSRSVPLPSVWIRAHGYQTEKAVSNLN